MFIVKTEKFYSRNKICRKIWFFKVILAILKPESKIFEDWLQRFRKTVVPLPKELFVH